MAPRLTHVSNLTRGEPAMMANPIGRHSAVLERAPPGISLAQRQARAKLPTLTIALDSGAFQILTAAAAHRRKPIEKLAADIIEGTVFLGSIPQQEAKALRYRWSSQKEKISARNSANGSRNRDIADCQPAQAGKV